MLNREEFIELLKDKGLKVTKQRLLVLDALISCPDKHLTTEEIYELVKTGYPEIGLTTVYRTIQLLLDLKLIDAINLNDGFVRYEIGRVEDNSLRHHHHHLICVTCGKVISFQEDLMDEVEERITTATGFEIVDHEVKLYGYCKECGGKLIEE